jgi:hypothetical protein
MSRHTPRARDAALSRLRRLNRGLIAGSVVATLILTEVAAHAFPGHTQSAAAAVPAATQPAQAPAPVVTSMS